MPNRRFTPTLRPDFHEVNKVQLGNGPSNYIIPRNERGKGTTMTDKEEIFITTQDGVILRELDRAFNYYDHKPGYIENIDTYAQPDTMHGQDSTTPVLEWNNYWFRFKHDDGSSCHLDGSRICSEEYARRKGWI